MRRVWLALPALVLLANCSGLDPARRYQDAARQLRFSLDRLEPSIQLAFPLEDSRIGFRVLLGVDNPSQVRFQARSFTGRIHLEEATQSHPIGQVAFSRGFDLPPESRSQMPVELSFSYRELNQSWGAIQSAVRGRKGTWRLEGQLQLEAFGIPITLPVHASRVTGN